MLSKRTILNVGDHYANATPSMTYCAAIISDVNVTGAVNTQIYNNVINGVHGDGSLQSSHGIYIQYGTSGLDIHNNTITNCLEGDGIKMAGGGSIYNNRIYNNYYAGVGVHNYTTSVTVNIYNNLFYENGYGVQQYDNTGTLTLNILNNTFYKNSVVAPLGNNSEVSIANNIASLTLKNNIFYASDGNLTYYIGGTPSTFASDYNVFYREDAGNMISGLGGTSRTWAAWTGLGYDAHSYNSNPLVISSSNLMLQAGSPAINAGTTGSGIPATDFLGKSRVGATDIGAYEKQ